MELVVVFSGIGTILGFVILVVRVVRYFRRKLELPSLSPEWLSELKYPKR